jgi:Uma2 family endonuclease
VAHGLNPIDPTHGLPPDPVIEIDVTHPSLDKLPIYAAFGVPEVWRYAGGRVTILLLVAEVCRAAESRGVLRQLAATDLWRPVAESRDRRWPEWHRALRSWVRSQRRGASAMLTRDW